jgi:hypothetical protein
MPQSVSLDLPQSNAGLDDTPTARLIRQVLGAISEFEKAMLAGGEAEGRSGPSRRGSRSAWC